MPEPITISMLSTATQRIDSLDAISATDFFVWDDKCLGTPIRTFLLHIERHIPILFLVKTNSDL